MEKGWWIASSRDRRRKVTSSGCTLRSCERCIDSAWLGKSSKKFLVWVGGVGYPTINSVENRGLESEQVDLREGGTELGYGGIDTCRLESLIHI